MWDKVPENHVTSVALLPQLAIYLEPHVHVLVIIDGILAQIRTDGTERVKALGYGPGESLGLCLLLGGKRKKGG